MGFVQSILNSPPIVCYGEIVFDQFGGKSLIGGAPFNVAQRIHWHKYPTYMISRIGNDLLGKQVLEYFRLSQMSSDYIQIDQKYLTGIVEVNIKKDGPQYEIVENVAWDYIEHNKRLCDLVSESKAFIFGSLGSRSEKSRDTLTRLLQKASNKVFDVNFRSPFYTKELISSYIEKTDFLKCNEDELKILNGYYGVNSFSLEDQISKLSSLTGLKHICVTLGSLGSILFYKQQFYYNKGYRVSVSDTIGAGDSFLATLIYNLCASPEQNPQNALDSACAMGALVASKPGGNPPITEKELQQLIH